ncbi:hypothetical protein ERO13_A06G008650v2 [Gossypium hirsutum]|uniref:Uncharacterized protein n=2 Tax=Gossypium TaxID=3633 RepID=A0A5D2PXT4_GOSTO|nr:hypothetical protein ERO13_A06G008650v2 [Gossypium hirsutum]TYH11745.1 hypothetical protein ES288_A06G010300v1 [Gossypium darwinii]TYI21031.1 hypothetical protein ES332_A06G009500v1 [Gossypium tomentosum]
MQFFQILKLLSLRLDLSSSLWRIGMAMTWLSHWRWLLLIGRKCLKLSGEILFR